MLHAGPLNPNNMNSDTIVYTSYTLLSGDYNYNKQDSVRQISFSSKCLCLVIIFYNIILPPQYHNLSFTVSTPGWFLICVNLIGNLISSVFLILDLDFSYKTVFEQKLQVFMYYNI